MNTTTIAYHVHRDAWQLNMTASTEDSDTLYCASFDTFEDAVQAASDMATVTHLAIVLNPGKPVFNVQIKPAVQVIEQDYHRSRVKPAPVSPAEAPSCDDQLDLWGDYPVTVQPY